ncbi:MAG TPA: FAD-dependent oxidoreductase, partial [Azospirillaceae bacterium]|nr:FAD-dependent oxidoreductase [Azospirillaceae bacterium]
MANRSPMASVLVVGAGLAGLACARVLAAAGLAVRVADKGRGPGGRLSTRREGGFRFDHGGQYLTARDPGFARLAEGWREEGIAAPWRGRIVRLRDGTVEESPGERIVGVPGMSSLVAALAGPLPVAYGTRVAALEREGAGWRARTGDGGDLGRADLAVVAVPSPQAVPLLEAAPALAAEAARARMAGCWAVMAAFGDGAEGPGWDAAFVADGGPLSWVARDGSKPGREARGTWVLHGAAAWSEAQLEASPDAVARTLLAAFRGLTGIRAEPLHLSAHRWRHAIPTAPLAAG